MSLESVVNLSAPLISGALALYYGRRMKLLSEDESKHNNIEWFLSKIANFSAVVLSGTLPSAVLSNVLHLSKEYFVLGTIVSSIAYGWAKISTNGPNSYDTSNPSPLKVISKSAESKLIKLIETYDDKLKKADDENGMLCAERFFQKTVLSYAYKIFAGKPFTATEKYLLAKLRPVRKKQFALEHLLNAEKHKEEVLTFLQGDCTKEDSLIIYSIEHLGESYNVIKSTANITQKGIELKDEVGGIFSGSVYSLASDLSAGKHGIYIASNFFSLYRSENAAIANFTERNSEKSFIPEEPHSNDCEKYRESQDDEEREW